VNVFDLRDRVIAEYANYVRSFVDIRDSRVRHVVDEALDQGLLWPEPFIGLSPAFEPGAWIDELTREGVLHEECARIFRRKSDSNDAGDPLRLHRHQEQAIRRARQGHSYVLTTGTGSGKSLAYIVPIVDAVLREGAGQGIKAIVVYPMNALANSQLLELEKFLKYGYPSGAGPVRFDRYTGQESDEQKRAIIADPPDILLTNYVMLELILTRVDERELVRQAGGLRFLVLDELHTYRGRQGADVAYLVRRTREACHAARLQCVGTSATLASEGGFEAQRRQVAEVAGQLFGTAFQPEDVIGETLQRATSAADLHDQAFRASLRRRIEDGGDAPPTYAEFVTDPLSSWVETALGLDDDSGRLVRRVPRRLRGPEGAAAALQEQIGLDEVACLEAIQRQLLAGYAACHPETGLPAFAFRLHQFLSRGETVYASLESPGERHLTVHGQRFVPGQRDKLLYPLVFCRECGQEYYSVRRHSGAGGRFEPRAFEEQQPETATDRDGYLYLSDDDPWPDGPASLDRLPEDWLEVGPGGAQRVKYSYRRYEPGRHAVATDGTDGAGATTVHFVQRPFRLCLHCGASYAGSQKGDFAKLATLGSGGRSTATTILSLATVRWLRRHTDRPEVQKLLAFTDNRQDASLQAGHFNDFVQTSLVRSALYQATAAAGEAGLGHDELTQRVFAALELPFEEYAANPFAEFGARRNIEAALRNLLGYRLYADHRRGRRVTAPNLEQTGLLRFQYESLDELCASERHWADRHPALQGADPATRQHVATVLLDYLRRELCLQVDYLDASFQERLRQQSAQLLNEPWALDENEQLEYARVAVPRSERPGDFGGMRYVSGRGGLARFLRRSSTFPGYQAPISVTESEQIILELLQALEAADLVHRVTVSAQAGDPPGYQVKAAGMRWYAGDGREGFHDPVRMPHAPDRGVRPNPYFVDLYRSVTAAGPTLEAREHTAQVPGPQREEREHRFREGRLPVLYCSPTMELGIDIASLNVVGMRNVPPTAANYAQRSGRAGRQGQPAMVFTYCSTGSPHDSYFFRRAERMIAGRVTPPRLDLSNADLVRAHIDAIWLAQSQLGLGRSLTSVVDASGEQPSLELTERVRLTLADGHLRTAARTRAHDALADVLPLLDTDLGGGWVDETLHSIPLRFDEACERWRGLYRGALAQARAQDAIIRDATRPVADKREAERRRQQAESQLRLLTSEVEDAYQSDFSSYRYFATEGFLPGYSFPRLPLSAWIPGRRGAAGRDEYLQRPRFVAISEFGPRNSVYHEGSRYEINRIQLPLDPHPASGEPEIITSTAKRCPSCGYLHPQSADGGADVCERCGEELGLALDSLLRLQHVFTRRRDRINADEEERQRHGYELVTAVRFAEREQALSVDVGQVRDAAGELVATLTYGPQATLWRINVGWRRRAPDRPLGFLLDVERGYWLRNTEDDDDDGDADPVSRRSRRVIPYVEDHRNCLVVAPAGRLEHLGDSGMASLESALRTAIAANFQLEDDELASEPLPSRDRRRQVLLYEAAEGGAGVLRRLLREPGIVAQVARTALELCHFDPADGRDLRRAPGASEDCEAACYDCLLSYQNQRDHPLLDRHAVRDALRALSASTVEFAPGAMTKLERLQQLLTLCPSDLQRDWLRHVDRHGYVLPSRAESLVSEAGTRPDFLYDAPAMAAVYVDGPLHALAELAARDAAQTAALEDLGYTVIRFGQGEDWDTTIARYPWVFGRQGSKAEPNGRPSS
jgi:ATP-dependent helicase YprA (DUF1998 family)